MYLINLIEIGVFLIMNIKQRIQNSYGDFYVKLLTYLALSISVTIFVLSTVLYINFENITLPLIHVYIKDNLKQVNYNADLMIQLSKKTCLQLYYDSNANNLFNIYKPDTFSTVRSLDYLTRYQSINIPNIHSIYIYNGITNTLYTSIPSIRVSDKNDFFDKEIFSLLDGFRKYKIISPIPRKVEFSYSLTEKTYANVYTFIYYNLPGKSKVLNDAVILNIPAAWMSDIINSLDKESESNTFIINNSGIALSDSTFYGFLTNISHEKYIQQILSSTSTSGFFTANINGVKSLVSYMNSESLDWRFVRITPYDTIVKKLSNMRLKTIIIGSIILLSGLLLSFILSKRFSKTYVYLTSKIKTLEVDKRSTLHTRKQAFLKNLFLEEYCYNPDTSSKSLDELEIKMNFDEDIVVLLVKIDNYADFCKNNIATDRSLLKFCIINIASELCSPLYNTEAVDMENDNIVILLNSNETIKQDFNGSLEKIARDIQSAVYVHLKFSISFFICSSVSKVNNLHLLYAEALETSRYRLFYGYGCIIFSSQINDLLIKEYLYPIDKEHQLVEALMLGKIDMVIKMYLEIIESINNHSYSVFYSTILRVALAINTSIEIIEKNSGQPFYYDFNTFIGEINSLETLTDINCKFFLLFEQILSKIEYKKSIKYDELFDSIINMIHNNYTDQNLCITSIANSLNMSPVYLGRLFKKLTSKSISEYINEYRMEKAKELLAATNYSVSEILDKTGFVNRNYFHTLFKKMHGLTPAEYRNANSNIKDS
jgi:two-component system, response regulator YesN